VGVVEGEVGGGGASVAGVGLGDLHLGVVDAAGRAGGRVRGLCVLVDVALAEFVIGDAAQIAVV